MRKGFTLVELLIVIVVIGVLSAMMILSSTEAVSTAKATKVISDMRVLKTATLAWYMDNLDSIEDHEVGGDKGFHIKIGNTWQRIHEYLNKNPDAFTKYLGSGSLDLNKNINWTSKTQTYASEGGYSVYMGKANTVCYIVHGVPKDEKLRSKLTSKAKSAGLLRYVYGSTSKTYQYDGGDYLFMQVFSLAN